MSKRRFRRGTLAVAAAAVMFAPGVAVADTHIDYIPACHPGYQCSTTFYGDVDKTEMVGYRDRLCDGTTVGNGTTSPFFTFSESRCY